jgi:ABC-2 type transport system permease protein/lipopolysaccharide transport system permease protein
VRAVDTIPEEPPAELRFRRKVGVFKSARALWRDKEIVFSLADRDFRARYKQALLGVAWAILNPLTLVLVFTFTIRKFAHVDTHGVPYPVWAYTGLVAWTFFAGAATTATTCLVNNQALLNKVSFPREAFPVAAVGLSCIDTAMSMIGLVAYFVIFGFVPAATLYWVPVIFVVQLAFTLGFSLIVSIVVVYLRDLRQIAPIIIQIGLFATPVAYNITQLLKPPWRVIYCTLNPMAPVIDSYRRVLLYGQMPQWGYLLPGAAMSFLLLAVGLRLFKRLEIGIADLI